MRELAEQVLNNDDGTPLVATPEHRMLVTLGFARVEQGRLLPRNRLYAEVVARHPLLSGGQAPPVGTRIAPFGSGAFGFVADSYLQTFAEEMVDGAYSGFNRGDVRLGLIGLGSALEAVLIDILEQTDQATLDTAKKAAK